MTRSKVEREPPDAVPPSPRALRSLVSLAAARAPRFVRETPVEHSPSLSRLVRGEVFLKLEFLQPTGSFKIRGAARKLLAIGDRARARGVVAASTGNHGMAVAYAARRLGSSAVVYAPCTASAEKLSRIRALGARVRRVGTDCLEAENAARRHANRSGRTFVSPYNDAEVIAGQGGVGVELARQVRGLDVVYASVGGGGLISGIAAAMSGRTRRVEVVGAQPSRSAVMFHSIRRGRVVELSSRPTLSDGTAGGVEPDSITFPLCRRLVDRFTLVSESAIAREMRFLVDQHNLLVEGAAACAVAALRRDRARVLGKTVAIVLCGRNVSRATLREVLR